MLRMELGRKYKFTLDSKKVIEIVIHGMQAGAHGMIEFDITVDGVRASYTDVNAALGEAYTDVVEVLP
jgi:hypothetical protein